ncbi:MAG TPA: prepilin-type N-terminal cleavage/methylation domain-containing protein [Tepidisphaeraceae bacterium]|nr:prepilin-type N-terminal cleavage/methylation domain-containing protein [Tepidisphaeraceae bacterium]
MRRPNPTKAFTLIELLVVIGIIGLLLGFLLPSLEKARHKAYIDACASNLRQIGQSILIYANDNHGFYPRTMYIPAAPITAGTSAPIQPNDMTAPLWLLIQTQKLPTSLFICPYNDVNEFEPDKANPSLQSNFTDYKKNLGYSYANPYPDDAATSAGYKLTSKLDPAFAILADLNPGVSAPRKADPFLPIPTSLTADMQFGNTANHEREGQNVLYPDCHVSYNITPFCGKNRDNIYTAQNAAKPNQFVSPAGPDDSILLPID